jgi:hypothetical protein
MPTDQPAFPPIVGEANRADSMRQAQCIPIRDEANGYKNTSRIGACQIQKSEPMMMCGSE